MLARRGRASFSNSMTFWCEAKSKSHSSDVPIGATRRRTSATSMKSAHSRRHGQGRGPRTITAAHHLTAVLAVGVARLSPANRISADLPNAASIVAIERRPPNVDISGPVSANGGHPPIARRSRFGEGPSPDRPDKPVNRRGVGRVNSASLFHTTRSPASARGRLRGRTTTAPGSRHLS